MVTILDNVNAGVAKKTTGSKECQSLEPVGLCRLGVGLLLVDDEFLTLTGAMEHNVHAFELLVAASEADGVGA